MRFFCKMVTWLLVGAFLFYETGPAFGIVWHPDGEPNLATWIDRPYEDVVGRWGNSASCVAVSSNCVITTQHQGGGVGTQVEIGGKTYAVTEVWNCGTADLRAAKLYGANLIDFVGIYEDTNEISKDIVMGGFGDGRDGLLKTGGVTYGYQWDNSSNTTLRWGTNKIDDTEDDSTLGSLTSDIIIGDFDELNEYDPNDFESAQAEHDSGGGWFIKSDGTWKVAGLSRAVEHFGESWFRNEFNPSIPDPDYMDAVRVSSYATWISETMPERLPGDLTGDDWVDSADFAVFALHWLDTECEYPDWCAGADCEPDGDVDWNDLACLMDGWLCNWECY